MCCVYIKTDKENIYGVCVVSTFCSNQYDGEVNTQTQLLFLKQANFYFWLIYIHIQFYLLWDDVKDQVSYIDLITTPSWKY